MSRGRKIALTLAQIGLGGALGAIGGGITYLFIGYLLWGKFLASVIQGGILYALLMLISFLINYGVIVFCAGEGVRLVTYWMQGEILPRKSVYQGAFLGIPAAAALLSMANYDWSSMDAGIFPSTSIIAIIRIIADVVSAPVKLLLILKFPSILLYIISAPIGAIIGYKLAQPEQLSKENVKEYLK